MTTTVDQTDQTTQDQDPLAGYGGGVLTPDNTAVTGTSDLPAPAAAGAVNPFAAYGGDQLHPPPVPGTGMNRSGQIDFGSGGLQPAPVLPAQAPDGLPSQPAAATPPQNWRDRITEELAAPGTTPDTGWRGQVERFGQGTAQGLVNPVLHPWEALQAAGKGLMAGGASGSALGVPAMAVTGNPTIDAQNAEAVADVRQEAGEQGVAMAANPANTAGQMLGGYLLGKVVEPAVAWAKPQPKIVGQNYTATQHASLAGVLARGTIRDTSFFPKEIATDIGSGLRQVVADNPELNPATAATPEDAVARTQAVLEKMQEQTDVAHAQTLAPVKDLPVDPTPLQSAVKFPETLEEFAPEDAAEIKELQRRLGTVKTLGGLNDLRQWLNRELANQFPKNTVAAGRAGAVTKGLEDALGATRDLYYQKLEQATGQNFQWLKRQESSVLKAQEALQNAAPRMAKQQAIAEQPLSARETAAQALKGVDGGFMKGAAKLVANKVLGSTPMTPIQEGLQHFFSNLPEPSPTRLSGQYVQPVTPRTARTQVGTTGNAGAVGAGANAPLVPVRPGPAAVRAPYPQLNPGTAVEPVGPRPVVQPVRRPATEAAQPAETSPAAPARVEVAPGYTAEDVAPIKAKRSNTGTAQEAAFQQRVQENGPQMVADYLKANTKNGVPNIATDAAKEQFPEYVKDRTNQDRLVASAASQVADASLRTVLKKPPAPGKADVRIMTASPGSGKTTGLTTPGEGHVGLDMESILDNQADAVKKVQQIIDSGRRPTILWSYVDDPAKTVGRMIDRARRIGRTVQLSYMAHAYSEIPNVLEHLMQHFGDQLEVQTIDNSGERGSAKLLYNQDRTPEFISKVQQQWTPERTTEAMNERLEQINREKPIPSDIYAAAKATDATGEVNARSGSGSDRPGNSGRNEQPAGGLRSTVLEKPAAPAAATTPVKNSAPPKDSGAATTVKRMRVSDIAVDPKRFQFKLKTDKAGVTDALKGRKWNEDLADAIATWQDPADGKTYVVNGHHRIDLAKANGVEDIDTKPILSAKDAGEARVVGAMQNIAQGKGTAVDAAKFFRDTEATPETLAKRGITLKEKLASEGMALSKLSGPIFDDVVAGKIPESRAVAIGRATENPAEQEAILKTIEAREAKGGRVPDDVVDEMARMARGAGEHTDTQVSLFGTQEMKRNLMLEKAEVSQYIRRRISQERRLFAGVSKENKVAPLAQAGNTINTTENAKIAAGAAQAQELYDRLSTRAGPLDDILNRGAADLAAGKDANGVKSAAYEQARAALSKTLGGAAGPAERGSEAAGATLRPAEVSPGTIQSSKNGVAVRLRDGTRGRIAWQDPEQRIARIKTDDGRNITVKQSELKELEEEAVAKR
jgi:hypothetical protein